MPRNLGLDDGIPLGLLRQTRLRRAGDQVHALGDRPKIKSIPLRRRGRGIVVEPRRKQIQAPSGAAYSAPIYAERGSATRSGFDGSEVFG